MAPDRRIFTVALLTRMRRRDHTERVSQRDPWTTLARVTGAAGLLGMVLIFVPIIALASSGEPPFEATREEVVAFFRNSAESSWIDPAEAVLLLGVVALTSFMVGLCLLLRRAEGEPAWRSTGTVRGLSLHKHQPVGRRQARRRPRPGSGSLRLRHGEPRVR